MNEDSIGVFSCANWDTRYRDKFKRNKEPKLIHIGRTQVRGRRQEKSRLKFEREG